MQRDNFSRAVEINDRIEKIRADQRKFANIRFHGVIFVGGNPKAKLIEHRFTGDDVEMFLDVWKIKVSGEIAKLLEEFDAL